MAGPPRHPGRSKSRPAAPHRSPWTAPFLKSPVDPATGSISCTYSNLPALAGPCDGAGRSNTADPFSVSPPGPTSPLLDRGNPSALASGESATDALGRPRVVSGAFSCVTLRRDQGAYEFQDRPGVAPIVGITGPGGAAAGTVLGFAAAVTPANGATATSLTWAFSDGAGATGPAVAHAFPVAGAQSVSLTVTDSNGCTAAATTAVSVTAPVPSPNPAPSGPPVLTGPPS